MTTTTTRKRRSTKATTRSVSSGQSRTNQGRSWLPRVPRGTGNVIGVILLVVAAFVAGYLVGRAGPPVMALEDSSVLVSRVIDGDTVELSGGSRVRYLCIDAPEQGEPLYDEAKERNRQLVEGKRVELVPGVTETDEYGLLLRYVYVDGALVNAVLVSEGLASTLVYEEDEVHAPLLRALESEAQAQGRGIWKVE